MMPSDDFVVRCQTPRIAAFLSTITLFALGGCGGTGGTVETDSSRPPTAGSGGPNSAPTITGAPPSTAVPGLAYSFAPTASDPNGDLITFEIMNRPTWASFDASNGRLSGTPTQAQLGMYSNIVISASDGSARVRMPAFSINVSPVGVGDATLSWVPPTLRSDGSALTNLAGYRIYYGNAPNSYSNIIDVTNVGLTTYFVENLASGTWYFHISAVDAAGIESSLTPAASKTIG
jgi:hypothetical protein